MNKKEFEKYLKKKYPIVCRGLLNKTTPSSGYILPIAFGIECGEGWYDLIEYAASKLEGLHQGIEFVQIKEKFGTSRIYVNNHTDEVEKILQFVEQESSTTCEMCGAKGTLFVDLGWWKTRCEKCKHKKWY
jgi:hypothetical protein